MILTCRKLEGAQEYGKGGGKLCAKHVFFRLQEHWLAMCGPAMFMLIINPL